MCSAKVVYGGIKHFTSTQFMFSLLVFFLRGSRTLFFFFIITVKSRNGKCTKVVCFPVLRYFIHIYFIRMVSWVIDVTTLPRCPRFARLRKRLINILDVRFPHTITILFMLKVLNPTKKKQKKTPKNNIAIWRSCIVFPLSPRKRIKSLLKNTFFMYWNNKHTFGNNFIILQIPSFHYFGIHI